MSSTAYLPGSSLTLRELRTQVRYHGEPVTPKGWRDVPAMGHAFELDGDTGLPDDIACRCTRTWAQHQAHPAACKISSAERNARQLRQGMGPRHCRNGHPRDEGHGEFRPRGKGVRPQWRCVTCAEQARLRGIERKREQRRSGGVQT